MGQKVSTLGDVFSWKNSDSTKHSENCTSVGGCSSSQQASSSATCAVHNNDSTDQQKPENIYVSNATAATSSALTDTAITAVECAVHPSKCCDGPSSNVQDTSKNMQTSSKSGSKKLNWVLRFNCTRPKSKSSKCCSSSSPPESVPEVSNDVKSDTCVCTRYRRTEDHHLGAGVVFDADASPPVQVQVDEPNYDEEEEPSNNMLDFDGAFDAFNAFDYRSQLVLPSFNDSSMDLRSDISGEEYMNEDFEDRAYKERAKEIQEGIEPPPGFRSGLQIQLLEFSLPKMTIDNLTSLFHRAAITALTAPHDMEDSHRIHTSIDYIHYLVPDLLQITNCSFYWGKMDRYEAEKLLENKPEGTFLLRDSAQEEYLFSVSFRKYGRSLHARIEQWNHLFSFDSRDPGVFASSTVCGLIEHYKDPSCCMFFEPMLTIPLHRNFTFSLQHTCRAAICSQITYDDVNQMKLPKLLKSYLKEYHYKQRVRVRIFDTEN